MNASVTNKVTNPPTSAPDFVLEGEWVGLVIIFFLFLFLSYVIMYVRKSSNKRARIFRAHSKDSGYMMDSGVQNGWIYG